MHPSIQQQLAEARITDMRRRAEYHRLAQVAAEGRRVGRQHGRRPVDRRFASVFGRCCYAVLSIRQIARQPAA